MLARGWSDGLYSIFISVKTQKQAVIHSVRWKRESETRASNSNINREDVYKCIYFTASSASLESLDRVDGQHE